MRSIWQLGVIAAAAITLAGVPAGAQVIFTLGNNPQPNEENVLLNTGATGTTISGTTNTTGTTVDFTSTETLTAPSNGQARVEGLDGVVGPEALTVSIPGGTFGDIIFNPFIGGPNAPSGDVLDVTANITGGGTATFSYTLGNGSNFLTITTAAGTNIDSVVLDPVVGFTDLRQIRVSGILIGGVPPSAIVPEPGAWAMMGGVGVSLLGLVRRRKS
jgi:hypothetical protein